MIAIAIGAIAVAILIKMHGEEISVKLVKSRHNANGVHPALLKLLDDWENEGWFTVKVLPDGGLRTDEKKQRELFEAKMTKARTLSETPHGHGGALDVAPAGFDPNSKVEDLTPEMISEFQIFGEWAESKGFTWGGRWRTTFPPYGDLPHVEMKNWLSLPMPKKGNYV